VLALLAAALVLPSALLVERALRGVAAEETARHRAVAERVFDEMERTLSDLVAREEERPVEAWNATAPEHIAALPAPFVVGYFQVEPDGRVTTPLPPRDPDALRAPTELLARARRDAAPPAEAKRQAERSFAQAPGTTVSLDDGAEKLRALGYVAKDAAAGGKPEPPTKNAYDALSSLNRGAEERQSRQRKVVEKREEAPAAAPAESFAEAEADRPVAERVAVDPLVGRFADERHLLL
jgi:hypothetical protein